MPWCDPCSQYHAPTALADGGVCPTCGETVHNDSQDEVVGDQATVGQSAPWHFWVVVALLIAYIMWRIVDLVRDIF